MKLRLTAEIELDELAWAYYHGLALDDVPSHAELFLHRITRRDMRDRAEQFGTHQLTAFALHREENP